MPRKDLRQRYEEAFSNAFMFAEEKRIGRHRPYNERKEANKADALLQQLEWMTHRPDVLCEVKTVGDVYPGTKQQPFHDGPITEQTKMTIYTLPHVAGQIRKIVTKKTDGENIQDTYWYVLRVPNKQFPFAGVHPEFKQAWERDTVGEYCTDGLSIRVDINKDAKGHQTKKTQATVDILTHCSELPQATQFRQEGSSALGWALFKRAEYQAYGQGFEKLRRPARRKAR